MERAADGESSGWADRRAIVQTRFRRKNVMALFYLLVPRYVFRCVPGASSGAVAWSSSALRLGDGADYTRPPRHRGMLWNQPAGKLLALIIMGYSVGWMGLWGGELPCHPKLRRCSLAIMTAAGVLGAATMSRRNDGSEASGVLLKKVKHSIGSAAERSEGSLHLLANCGNVFASLTATRAGSVFHLLA